MKKILILGGSKGIGLGCSTFFKELNQTVITVARTNADLLGDINDEKFRKYLIDDIDADVVINSIGCLGVPITSSLTTNLTSMTDLITKFYFKLKEGSHIINISSIASLDSFGHLGRSIERITYSTSKNAISNFCVSLARSRTRDIHVSTIEPDIVIPTSISTFNQTPVDEKIYEEYKFNQFSPIRPIDVAKTVEWIIQQPKWMNVCRLTINNHYR